jgi:C-3',4' desaturase CrtD
MKDQTWDWIVIGAGLGGLLSAALLKQARPDESVLILESHTDVGGCAGCFERNIELPGYETKQRVRFDVGATTLSALEKGQSLAKVLDLLNFSLPTHKANPGVRVILKNGSVVNRYAEEEAWFEESARHFGNESVALWKNLAEIERRSWQVLDRFPRFPPTSMKDVLSLVRPGAIEGARLLHDVKRPLLRVLEDLNLDSNVPLRTFIDQLLLVSTQTTSKDVSVLGAALGLTYPSHTYYLDGGVYMLSALLLRRYLELGGAIKFKHRVNSIVRHGKFSVSTQKAMFSAKLIISNATLWNTRSMLPQALQSHRFFGKLDGLKAGEDIWGANAIYLVIPETYAGSALYHQVHEDEHSLFISISREGDLQKAPTGYRTLTASIHEADPARWLKMTDSEYAANKEILCKRTLNLIDRALPGAAGSRVFEMTATPRTFEFYTKRRLGLVGGVAYKAGRYPWRWPSQISPVPGLYLVGDTIFPGQSAGAVAQCTLSLMAKLELLKN